MAKRKSKEAKENKRQAIGVLLLGIALLLFLSIISFNVSDPVNLSVEGNRIAINNWLGPLGAMISYILMQWTLGYPILVLPGILALIGLYTVQGKNLEDLIRPSISFSVWALFISVFLAMPEALETAGQITEYYPSGLIGGWIASKFIIYLGKFGGLSLLLFLTLALLVLTMRIEVTGIIAVLSDQIRSLRAIARSKWDQFLEQRQQAKEIRLIRKQEQEEQKKQEEQKTKLPTEENPPEIKIGEPTEKISVQDESHENTDSEDSGLIETSLDEIIAQIDKAQRNRQQTRPEPAEKETEGEEDVDFEFREETKDVELDYDDLVKESIARYKFPSIDLLEDPVSQETTITKEELKSNAELLELKLLDFGVNAKVIRVTAGPVITLYELQPAPGVKVSSIVNLANDLALAMEARGIRMIAPIPGKAAVGIEIPNRNPQMVYLKPLIRSEKFNTSNFELPLALGKTINGESYITDLTKMPHLLIAGSTGAGKSVGINTIIVSLMYSVNPGKVKFMMIDPKKLELSLYKELRDHYLLWRTDLDEEVITKPNNAVSMLNSIVLEMERRYDKLAHLGVRNIVDYDRRIQEGGNKVKDAKLQQLPYIVVLIDELADLMMVAAKEVETPIARLAQMARAVGIHLIVATQRPSVDVITGMIKANFPARIAYQVATKVDSRTILDMNGAEQLLGNGDMLFLPAGLPKPVRLQNPFVSTKEVEEVINHVSRQPKLPHYSLPQPAESRQSGGEFSMGSDRDPLYADARAIVVQHQQGSISLLQRRLKIGYARAARLMDELEEDGVVGAPDGSKPREVLMTLEELGQI
ncbi:MAG: DNA translocase FtsK 4TM domain-containing protein [Calditrichaceae bacterium]